MKEWKIYKLGELMDIKGGKRLPKGEMLTTTKNSHPYIRIRDLGATKTLELTSSFEYVDDEVQKHISRYIVNNNDVILSIVGTIGLVAIVGNSLNNANLTENCVKFVNLKRIDSNYLYYFLISPLGQDEISKGIVGAVQPKLPIKNIENISIPVPDIVIQQKIASILTSIDAKIEVNRQINDNLEQQAQALYKSWFVDFEPFKDGEFVESEMGEIPVGWTVVKFSDLTEIPKKTINPQKFPDTIFKQYSLPACDNGLIPENQTGKDIMSNKIILQNNTTLFSKLNPRIKRIWFTCEVQPNSICSTEFIPYRATNENESGYIFSIINSEAFYASVMGCVNGATGSHQRFHAEDTEDFLCAYNKDVVKKFSQHINAVLKQIHDLRQENVKLALMRDTLLPKLMSGELKINEIDC